MLIRDSSQLVFFLGKGGVGKTTLSLAYALKFSEVKGGRTLIASLDPAHNLGNFLGMSLGGAPSRIQEGLYAVEIDFEEALRDSLINQIEKLKGLYKELTVWNLEKNLEILRWVPGSEEQALLKEIERIVEEDWSRVIFDMPPTGLALRVILLPKLMQFWLERLEALRERILSLRETIESIRGTRGQKDSVIEALREQKNKYRRLIEILENRENSYFFVVLEPSAVSLDESRKISKSLEENRIALKALLLNKFRKYDERDLRILQQARDSFSVPLFVLPFVGRESKGEERVFEELAPLIPEGIL